MSSSVDAASLMTARRINAQIVESNLFLMSDRLQK